MENIKDFLLIVTRRLFSNWTALKLAVEHGMGSKERANYFCSYIAETIYMNEKLDTSDIASVLEEYMDEHFDVELEDDSEKQLANELLRFHKYCSDGNEVLALEEFAKLAPVQPWISSIDSLVSKTNNRSLRAAVDSSSDDDDDDVMDTADDGWEQVKTRRR